MKKAGPWTSSNGCGPCRDSVEDRPVTLAWVYPTTVYVRARFGDDWTEVRDQDAADAFLRAAGWALT